MTRADRLQVTRPLKYYGCANWTIDSYRPDLRELMTESLVKVESEEPVAQAARLMDQKETLSVLVKRQVAIVGIITPQSISARSAPLPTTVRASPV